MSDAFMLFIFARTVNISQNFRDKFTEQAQLHFVSLLVWRLIGSPAAEQNKNWECERYARIAVDQYQQGFDLGYNFSGARWQNNYDNHYLWCESVPVSHANADRHARITDLENCYRSPEYRSTEDLLSFRPVID